MMPRLHMAASAILAILIFGITNSLSSAALCFAMGSFIDIDHIFDYYLYSRRISLDVSEISGFYLHFKKIIVILHSYELLIPLAIIGFTYHAQTLLLGAVTGFIGHIFMDTLAYEMRPRSYFFLYRVMNGFRLERLCGHGKK